MDFEGAKTFITGKLRNELNPGYTYHNADHTMDVYNASARLIGMEGVPDEEGKLIGTAALFHDSGMLSTYADHEAASVSLARSILPEFGFSDLQLEMIGRLIMCTRLPQRAKTKAEQIICDADLDYLGRDDFFIHSFELQLEWNRFGIHGTNLEGWLEIQIKFLSEHSYFTKSAAGLRNKKKSENLNEILTLWQQKNPKKPSTTTLS